MKNLAVVLAVFGLGLLVPQSARCKELADFKVLYVGSERAPAYLDFLKDKVAKAEAKTRDEFTPSDADGFDVVLLDWPQTGDFGRRKPASPLGARDQWNKPTVLLGSAGLKLAMAWDLKGGSGCTCLDPLAYDLREHEIFSRPLNIDRGKMISIPTPDSFQGEISTDEIKVLALVDDRGRHWQAGWCTHARQFDVNPDIEFFCGGVNHQTPTSAALWRQGNLLHFGFEQSPAEMNEHGRSLLLNSIAYISRFTQDRPIAVTPSVFTGPAAAARSTVLRWARPAGIEAIKHVVTPETLEKLVALSDDGGPKGKNVLDWFDKNARYLRPGSDQLLELDEDLVALDVTFDQPEFFTRAISALRSEDDAAKNRGRRLLERYVPDVPKGSDADRYATWWRENQPYCFASDAGDYRWYVDPLARKRQIPSSELRGPKRAD
ncbi:MAG TPA: hypothetical protein VGG30_08930 [Pirellulales bacterium]|jgi:hypothetical protein